MPELYRSVSKDEIEKQGWSLVPSKYIEFIDHDLEIDYAAEMSRIQKEMREVLAQEMKSQKMLEDAFRGLGMALNNYKLGDLDANSEENKDLIYGIFEKILKEFQTLWKIDVSGVNLKTFLVVRNGFVFNHKIT